MNIRGKLCNKKGALKNDNDFKRDKKIGVQRIRKS